MASAVGSRFGRVLATLHQAPGIVRVFDFLEFNGTAYIVMELLQGATLEAHLRRHGPMAPPAIERILSTLLDGLEQVHAAGFLHRDIKPANILLNAAGSPTLIDFGASRAAMAGRTAAMTAIFTPGYAAAEQMTSARQGPWTDIYGLSATLYHAIVGKAPPSAFDRMLDDAYQPIVRLAPPGFAPGLLAGIDAGLAVRASDRPQTIAGWRAILSMKAAPADAVTLVSADRWQAAQATPAAPPPVASVPASAATAGRKRLGLYVGLAALVLALAAGGSYLMLAPRSAAPQRVALEELKVEDLEKVLAERRKAEAAAAERRRLEEEAERKAKAEADAKRAADAELEKAQFQRKQAEEELARVKADIEARRKQEAEQRLQADAAARRAAEEEARRRIEAETAALRAAEQEARDKVAAEAAAKQQADEALARAEASRRLADQEVAARQKAEAEAKQKADAETVQKAEIEAKQKAEAEVRQKAEAEARQKAEAEVAAAEKKAAEAAEKTAAEVAEKKAAEAAETALRLAPADRQRLQVALTLLGFDTRGSDGAFGPRSRDMIAAWQKARGQPSTGFVTGPQQQALLREAAAALSKYDEEQKKIEDDKKKADEAKRKTEDEAKARSAAPTPAPPAAAPAPPQGANPFDGNYQGRIIFPAGLQSISATVVGGRGTGMWRNARCGDVAFTLTIAPAGQVMVGINGYDASCRKTTGTHAGRVEGNQVKLSFPVNGGNADFLLSRR